MIKHAAVEVTDTAQYIQKSRRMTGGESNLRSACQKDARNVAGRKAIVKIATAFMDELSRFAAWANSMLVSDS